MRQDPDEFSVATATGPGYDLLSLAGEFDLSAKPTADAELHRLTAPSDGMLIVDLRDVTFIDSSGVHSIVVAHRECEASGRLLVLLRGQRQVMRILSMFGLTERLTVVDSLEQALELPPARAVA